jgi:hypothetical protein
VNNVYLYWQAALLVESPGKEDRASVEFVLARRMTRLAGDHDDTAVIGGKRAGA